MNQLNKSGFSLVEIMVVVALLTVMMAGVYASLSVGQSAWFATDAGVELQENLRQAIEKLSRELRESGFDSANADQFTITDGGGVNSTDVIRFSIPVLCQTGMNLIDNVGNVSYWGAPLTWGCTSSTCMDADNSCGTVDYKFIEYTLDAGNQLLRRVLNAGGVLVRQDVVAQNIVDLQLTLSADKNIITVQMIARRTSGLGRVITSSTGMDVYLRN